MVNGERERDKESLAADVWWWLDGGFRCGEEGRWGVFWLPEKWVKGVGWRLGTGISPNAGEGWWLDYCKMGY